MGCSKGGYYPKALSCGTLSAPEIATRKVVGTLAFTVAASSSPLSDSFFMDLLPEV